MNKLTIIGRTAAYLACPISFGLAVAGLTLTWALTSIPEPVTIQPGASFSAVWAAGAIGALLALTFKMAAAPPPFMLQPPAANRK